MSIEGIPDGYELVAIRKAKDGEIILKCGEVDTWHRGGKRQEESTWPWPILRRVPKKLKLEVGKYYRAINGKVFGPLAYSGPVHYRFSHGGKYWSEDGVRYIHFDQATENLVEEGEAPKPPEPKYRPFATAGEFAPHREKWIKRKHNAPGDPGCWKPQAYHEKGVHTAEGKLVPYTELVDYQFEDGTPCGVKV